MCGSAGQAAPTARRRQREPPVTTTTATATTTTPAAPPVPTVGDRAGGARQPAPAGGAAGPGCASGRSASTPSSGPSAWNPTATWRCRRPPRSVGTGSGRRLEPAGSAVLAAHVDYDGVARCVLPPAGARGGGRGPRSTSADGTARPFGVTGAATRSPRTSSIRGCFARDGRARLALITCGGAFDRTARSYRDNVVAIAEPVGMSPWPSIAPRRRLGTLGPCHGRGRHRPRRRSRGDRRRADLRDRRHEASAPRVRGHGARSYFSFCRTALGADRAADLTQEVFTAAWRTEPASTRRRDRCGAGSSASPASRCSGRCAASTRRRSRRSRAVDSRRRGRGRPVGRPHGGGPGAGRPPERARNALVLAYVDGLSHARSPSTPTCRSARSRATSAERCCGSATRSEASMADPPIDDAESRIADAPALGSEGEADSTLPHRAVVPHRVGDRRRAGGSGRANGGAAARPSGPVAPSLAARCGRRARCGRPRRCTGAALGRQRR